MPDCPHQHQGGRGASLAPSPPWGPHSVWCFCSERQMASAQNLLALPALRAPRPSLGAAVWSSRAVRVAASRPGLGGLWELPAEGPVSSSVNRGVRGQGLSAFLSLKPSVNYYTIYYLGRQSPQGKGPGSGQGSLLWASAGSEQEGRAQPAGPMPAAAEGLARKGTAGGTLTLRGGTKNLLGRHKAWAPSWASGPLSHLRPLGHALQTPQSLLVGAVPGGGGLLHSPLSFPLTKASHSRNHCMLMQ